MAKKITIPKKTNNSLSNKADLAAHKSIIVNQKKTITKLHNTVTVQERLLNILSHDVYSPLRFSTMVGKAVLTKKSDLNKEEILDALTDINQTGIRMLLLISNILKWVEYQKENFDPLISSENLRQIVQDKMDFFQFMADSKNLKLKNLVDNNIYLNVDSNALGIIIQNLLNNALKFTSNGSIIIESFLKENAITISVTDTGLGMPQTSITLIKKGQNINPLKDAENQKGNGLGWILIKELLKRLKGKFNIVSKLNEGTKVSIILPLKSL